MKITARNEEGTSPTGEPLWAYAYQMVPPRAEYRMRPIRALLKEENGRAKHGARSWTPRLVVERQVTHVLIVSDSPDLDREVNRRLEAKLKELDVRFSITVPIPVGGGTGPGAE